MQVLYARLWPMFGYDAVSLQVLEREGWCHRLVIDQGVLQDVRRFRVADSYFADHYRRGATIGGHFSQAEIQQGRGPGAPDRPQTYIWVPITHLRQLIGAVIYQLNSRRRVPETERAFLEEIHAHVGPILSSAYLHELTRNQALSLGALNDIGRTLSSTHDEQGVVSGLLATLASRVEVDVLELVVPDTEHRRARVLRVPPRMQPEQTTVSLRSPTMTQVRRVLASGQPRLQALEGTSSEHRVAAWVPVRGGASSDAVLVLRSRQAEAYEESTLAFLSQVADQVALALRNAWSYAQLEAQRRRLEAVEAIGRRLASSLDRWSIARELRAELSRHLEFDVFTLGVVDETEGGPVAEGYVYDSGKEQPLITVPLNSAGPARRAYETGRPVLVPRASWSSALERRDALPEDRLVEADGAVLMLTERSRQTRRAARSVLWVPVSQGGRVRALLSLQSYQANTFDESHVGLLQDIAVHVSLAVATADMFTRMRAILEHTPVGVLLEDRGGSVSFVNPAVENIYGIRADRLLGLPSQRLFDAAGADELEVTDQQSPDVRRYRLPAREATVEVRTVVIPGSAEQPWGVLTLHEDVTQEQALQAGKDLMLRAIGHEVRSPAAAMRSVLASLLEWGIRLRPEEQESLLGEAYQQSERLLRVVEAQLIIAKLEQSQFEPAPTAVELPDALERATRLLAHRYGERALQVRRHVPADLPAAWCESTHLDEVLVNLIGNALEHTRDAAVSVTIERQQGAHVDGARLNGGQVDGGDARGGQAGGDRRNGSPGTRGRDRARQVNGGRVNGGRAKGGRGNAQPVNGHGDGGRRAYQGPWLSVSVADTGSGLPVHRLERVFERGGLPGSHRARGGLGLGLHLCRLIVERSFGGEIGVVRSGPDGTMVTFTVPVEASAAER